MKGLKEYDVSFSGLKNGKHTFEFPIDQKFFDLFDTDVEFDNYRGTATIELDKNSTFMEADIKTKGTVDLQCDISTDTFPQDVENEFHIIIKFGDEYNDEDDEILILPHEAYQFNAAQYIYENILLSIPLKKICPNCEDEDELYISDETDEDENETDPRWDALKKFKE